MLIQKLTGQRYRNFPKINDLYLRRGCWTRVAKEIATRADGLNIDIDRYYFSGHNPLRGPEIAIKWIVERYKPAFDYLDANPAGSILEIGCAFGLSSWLMTDVAKQVTGMDINQTAIKAATKMFPEATYICQDYREYFRQNPGKRFDVILDCNGPIDNADPASYGPLMEHCDKFITIGYRAKSWSDLLLQKHKMPGRQLSYDCTVRGANLHGISPRYPLYYPRREYVRTFLHAVKNGYYVPV